MFGGHSWRPVSWFSDIVRFDETTFKWSKIGQLNHARNALSVVWSQEHFLVFGGDDGENGSNGGEMKTEKCYFTAEEEVACVEQAPVVQFVEYNFSEMFNVANDYCSK